MYLAASQVDLILPTLSFPTPLEPYRGLQKLKLWEGAHLIVVESNLSCGRG